MNIGKVSLLLAWFGLLSRVFFCCSLSYYIPALNWFEAKAPWQLPQQIHWSIQSDGIHPQNSAASTHLILSGAHSPALLPLPFGTVVAVVTIAAVFSSSTYIFPIIFGQHIIRMHGSHTMCTHTQSHNHTAVFDCHDSSEFQFVFSNILLRFMCTQMPCF